MNKHSLLFYISLFFIFLLLVINTLFFVQYRLEKNQAIEALAKRFHDSERVLHLSRMDMLPFKEAKERLYTILQVELLHENEVGDLSSAQILKKEREMTIYAQGDDAYCIVDDKPRNMKIYLKYVQYHPESNYLIIMALLINLSLFLFYFYILQRLKPLKILKNKIVRFAEGDLTVSTHVTGKDEIAEVSNEFNNAIEKIRTLQDSRKLFLRNIMHELKTPIAKGKLITDLMDDAKNQERLKRIFRRFEYLLSEFTKIERVTSNAMTLNKKRYRVMDILENAFDIMMIEMHAIDIEVHANLEIDADYDLMSIVLKNLIDNAMKYGKGRAKVILYHDRIVIESQGEKLENISFDKVFNRSYEDSSKGLGLGLYISKNIVKKHGYRLDYAHHEGKNRFIISF